MFGQRPRTVVFQSKADENVFLEEELEGGVCFEENPERVPGKLTNEMERKQSEGVLSEVQTKNMKEMEATNMGGKTNSAVEETKDVEWKTNGMEEETDSMKGEGKSMTEGRTNSIELEIDSMEGESDSMIGGKTNSIEVETNSMEEESNSMKEEDEGRG